MAHHNGPGWQPAYIIAYACMQSSRQLHVPSLHRHSCYGCITCSVFPTQLVRSFLVVHVHVISPDGTPTHHEIIMSGSEEKTYIWHCMHVHAI